MQKNNIHTFNLLLLSISVHAILFLALFFILTLIEEDKQNKSARTKIVLQQYVTEPSTAKGGHKLHQNPIDKVKVKEKTRKKKVISKKENIAHIAKKDKKVVDQNKTVLIGDVIPPANSEIIYPNNSIKSSYGPKFFDLTKEEQEYIITNWELTNKINSGVGGRVARQHDLTKVTPGDSNTIQFYLHPDGNITDITFLNHRDNSVFDEIIKQTIIHSHMYYNFPKTKTLMQIYISVEKKDGKN